MAVVRRHRFPSNRAASSPAIRFKKKWNHGYDESEKLRAQQSISKYERPNEKAPTRHERPRFFKNTDFYRN
jgi:murein L,D-transpeptidase YafK